MENPDQPIYDPRYEDFIGRTLEHTDDNCEWLATKVHWHLIVKRLTEYYMDNPDQFHQDHKEIHG